MNAMRMNEAAIDAKIDACLQAARQGDVDEGRHLHDLLGQVISERDTPEGRLWLTDHARSVLAVMHRRLAGVEGGGEHFRSAVLEAVQLGPRRGHWLDNSGFVRDLRVAMSVAHEMCEQRHAGGKPDVDRAVDTVANRGEFGLSAERIREVYEEIASSVGGFREMSSA